MGWDGMGWGGTAGPHHWDILRSGAVPPCTLCGQLGVLGVAQLRAVGWHRVPTGLEDVSKYPMLVAELLKRNWTEPEVRGALAENLLRVFIRVEEVSGAWGGTGQGTRVAQGASGMGMYGTRGHLA